MPRIRFNYLTVLLALTALAVMFFQPAVVEGQVSTGGIEGVVSDANGAVVAGAKVAVTEKRTGRTLTATTSGRGLCWDSDPGQPVVSSGGCLHSRRTARSRLRHATDPAGPCGPSRERLVHYH